MAANPPKVSALLPSLNSRKFLEPRVDSLLQQTFANWEAIVLDSGSTDGSWEFFKSVAETDSRFRLHRVPREGLYAALNRGLEFVTGDFMYIAPCDDTMAPEFFSEMIKALGRCPDAGIAVCDCLFINQDGQQLRADDMSHRLSKRQIKNLLGSGAVRSSLPALSRRKMNYRPPPHDCLLHFTGRSVYFSLTQLLVRTVCAKAAGYFETKVGSAADFQWLVRLTSKTGSVHLPKALATWRFHGNQLSLDRDDTRPATMSQICREILPEICRRHSGLLTYTDCKLLMLPYTIRLGRSMIRRVGYWLQGIGRVLLVFARNPLAILRVLYRTGIGRNFPISVVLQRRKLVPRDLDTTA